MNTILITILPTFVLASSIFCFSCGTPPSSSEAIATGPTSEALVFKHHYVRSEMPEDDWFHSVTLADLDNDGDLDVTIASARGSRKARNFFWYEYLGADNWEEHLLGDMEETQQGADVADVNGDGWIDIISGNHWYQNSQKPKNIPFTKHRYRQVNRGFHDVAVAEIDGDGKMDIVTLSENHGVFWYQQPKDPTELWPECEIAPDGNCPHGAFGPEGIGDLDKDGDNDVLLVDRWLENESQGRSWIPHYIDFGRWSVPTWGGPEIMAARSVVRDLDEDGDNDIVMTECDIPEAVAAVFYNLDGNGAQWEKVMLPQTAPGRRGSLHSLRVADFDLDGNLDILSIDQEDCRGDLPLADPRWYVWRRVAGRWVEQVVLDANLGGHEAWTGDVDGDGDIDIVSKTWRSGLYKESANQGAAHIDYLENLTIK